MSGSYCNWTWWSGESADAVPHYHKLCSRDSHIWGIRTGQHNRSAMAEPRPGWTTFMIMVSPLPGKYELEALETGSCFSDTVAWLTVPPMHIHTIQRPSVSHHPLLVKDLLKWSKHLCEMSEANTCVKWHWITLSLFWSPALLFPSQNRVSLDEKQPGKSWPSLINHHKAQRHNNFVSETTQTAINWQKSAYRQYKNF